METTNIPIPDYVRDARMTQTDETAQASLPRLTVKAGKFIYRIGEELINLGATVDIIILAIAPPTNYVNHRSWWEADYDPDAVGSQPDCFSDLGNTPDKNSLKPQAETCATCKWSEAGSAGFKKAQACASFKILYAVFPYKPEEIFVFKAAVTTLKSLGQYRFKLKTAQLPIAGVITRLTFDLDPTLDYSKTEYAYAGVLPEKLFGTMTALAASGPIEALLAVSAPVAQIEAPADNDIPDLPPPPKANPVSTATPVTAAIPNKPEANAMLNELASSQEDNSIQIIAECLINSKTQKKMLDVYEKFKPTIFEWGTTEKTDLKKLLENKIATFKTPVGQLATRLDECVEATELLKLCTEIAELNVVDTMRQDFIIKADELNGTTYDTAVYGQTKEKMPALCKDGSYKVRKQPTIKKPEPIAAASVASGSAQPAATGNNEQASDDILRDLDLD